jgi:hypothetical protein
MCERERERERERDHLKKQIFKGVKSLKKKRGGGM